MARLFFTCVLVPIVCGPACTQNTTKNDQGTQAALIAVQADADRSSTALDCNALEKQLVVRVEKTGQPTAAVKIQMAGPQLIHGKNVLELAQSRDCRWGETPATGPSTGHEAGH